MAKKEKDFNIHEAPVEDLQRRLEKSQQDLFKLKFRAASAPLKDTMEIQRTRREIARLNTFITQRGKNK